MIATHDSLTAYPVKFWFLKPFNFLCKCQSKTLEEQHDAGVRSFDLRFAKWNGSWYAAHGAQLYTITLFETFLRLRRLTERGEPIYFRVICEDTFWKSDVDELDIAVNRILKEYPSPLKPLYIRSKCTWEMVNEYEDNKHCADYPDLWDTKYTRKGMAGAVQQLYELKTSEDKMNFIACYSSKFIPRFTAKILTKIALKKKWKENDVPVIDFV